MHIYNVNVYTRRYLYVTLHTPYSYIIQSVYISIDICMYTVISTYACTDLNCRDLEKSWHKQCLAGLRVSAWAASSVVGSCKIKYLALNLLAKTHLRLKR